MAEQNPASWPPAEGLTTVNVPRQDVILTTSASTRIMAPAALVFAVLLHAADYGNWNTFCPRVAIHTQPQVEGPDEKPQFETLQKDTVFTFYVIMNSAKPSKETPTQLKITDISTPEHPSNYISADILQKESSFTADLTKTYRVSWKCEGGFVARGLRTERFHEVIVLSDSECEVRTWECQGGVLARTVKWMYEKTLEEKFQLWCADLKKYCEKKASDAHVG